ncbi:MAG TPA: tetratricopeptide repeat protein [Candidatus Acidoferrum sp.]|nr:tetratricopeptide repeat protein [Candidatus Acidoferrum sp.]
MASPKHPRPEVKEKSAAIAVPSTRLTAVILPAILVLATLAAFWPVLNSGFINYDDTDYVTANPHVQAGLSLTGLRWAFQTDCASNWHPLTWLSHMLDVSLFGKGPAGPHAVNLFLHVVNSLLLLLLLQRATAAQWRSALVAGLFALHPQHVESVAWIAERKDVLSTMFGLLTLWAFVRYAEAEKEAKGAGKFFYGLSLLVFALGLMSKPMLVTLPLVMLLLDYWPLGRLAAGAKEEIPRTFQRLIVEKAPFLVMSTLSCLVTMWAQEKAILSLENLPLSDRTANTVIAYVRYLGKAIWPDNLALPYLHLGRWSEEQVAAATAVLITLSLGAIWIGRIRPYVITGWFWFLGTLIPVIGLVQVGSQAMADRYTYVPLIGVFIIAVWGTGDAVLRWPALKRVVAPVGVLILAAYGWQSHRQAMYWHDSETLFKRSAAVTTNNFIALCNVGGVYFERGRLDEALDYYQQATRINPRYADALNSIGAVLAAKGDDDAEKWFHRALDVQPTQPDALFNLGNFMAKKGRTQEAGGYFEASLKAKPDNFEARNNLANLLVRQGRLEEAIAQYQLALEQWPDAALIHKNLGEMLAAKGKLDEAMRHYRQAIALTNDPGAHYSLGLTLAVQGKWDEAIGQYEQTLRLWPTNAEAYYNLGYALRIRGQLGPARTNFLEALRLKPDFPLARFNLGCVYAEENQPAEAAAQWQEALRLKPDYEAAREKLRALRRQAGDGDQ